MTLVQWKCENGVLRMCIWRQWMSSGSALGYTWCYLNKMSQWRLWLTAGNGNIFSCTNMQREYQSHRLFLILKPLTTAVRANLYACHSVYLEKLSLFRGASTPPCQLSKLYMYSAAWQGDYEWWSRKTRKETNVAPIFSWRNEETHLKAHQESLQCATQATGIWNDATNHCIIFCEMAELNHRTFQDNHFQTSIIQMRDWLLIGVPVKAFRITFSNRLPPKLETERLSPNRTSPSG
jgi:hypothetical protein